MRELENQVERALKGAPEGKLRCAVNKGSYQYYIGDQYQNKTRRKLVEKIAQKEYCEKLLGQIKKRRSALEKIMKAMREYQPEMVYNQLHPARKQIVKPYVKSVADIVEEFEKMQYVGKGFLEEDETTYYTVKGERVRSKSEKIIADTLYRKAIPYHYEFPLDLKFRNKTVVVYPDFTVLNKRNGKKYIWEHLGMMDKPSYFENAIRKIDLYEKNGILLGDGLFITHEMSGSTLDTKVMEEYVERYLC